MKISIRGVDKNSLRKGVVGLIPIYDCDGYFECADEVTMHDFFTQSPKLDEMIPFTKWDSIRPGTRAWRKIQRRLRLKKLGLYKPSTIPVFEEEDLPF